MVSALGALMLVQQRQFRRWWPVWAAWAGIFVLYSLVSAYVADMVLKHIFIVMPLVCIWMAIAFERWWRRGVFGRAVVLAVLGFLAVDVALKGHYYLLVKRHF
jgi:hypothetical protein